MSTDNLVHCVNCEHIVSKKAECCPHCSQKEFMGHECVFCEKRSKKKDLLKLHSSYVMHKLSTYYAHERCFQKNLNIEGIDNSDFHCQDCQAIVQKEEIKTHLIKSYKSIQNHQIICANCGSTEAISHLIGTCFFCGSTILKGFHEYETVKINPTGYYREKYTKEVPLHKNCINKLDNSIIAADKSIFNKFVKHTERLISKL